MIHLLQVIIFYLYSAGQQASTSSVPLSSLFSTLLLELPFEKCKPDTVAPLVKEKEPTVFSHYVLEKVQNSLPTSPFLSYP